MTFPVHRGGGQIIPRSVLENARGFAIFTIFKAGFLFSARAGSGIVIAKLADGSEYLMLLSTCLAWLAQQSCSLYLFIPLFVLVAWSAPSAIGTAGVGVGGQAGAEMTDFLVVLNSSSVSRIQGRFHTFTWVVLILISFRRRLWSVQFPPPPSF